MHQYLKCCDTIRFYAPCNIFRKFYFIFSIFNSNLKIRQILHCFGFLVKRPVTGQTEPVYQLNQPIHRLGTACTGVFYLKFEFLRFPDELD
jgi:hypothetical protein